MVGFLGFRIMHPPQPKALQPYLFFSGVFLIHQYTQMMGWHVRILDHYLDPFLAVPVMMGTALLIIRLWRPKEVIYPTTNLLFTVGLILFFESGWFEDPRIHPDAWDIPGYIVGSSLFHFTINRPVEESPSHK